MRKFYPKTKKIKPKFVKVKRKVIQQEIEERKDKEFLTLVSKSLDTLKKALSDIENEVVVFIGQYANSRKKEALEYLERTIKEREN